MNEKTSWPRVAAFFMAGVASAFLVGKAPPFLPLLRSDLGLSLFQAGLVLALFNLIAGFGGILFGALADRFGHARIGVIGLLVAAAGSGLGAFAENPDSLLASRILEGFGFFLAIVSMPPLMLRAATQSDRFKVMGLWGAYMPTGTAIMMLLGGLLAAQFGWRGVWLLSALFILVVAVGVGLAARQAGSVNHRSGTVTLADFATVARHRGPMLLALTFAAYAGQYNAIALFIPLILVETAGWGVAEAGAITACIVASNIIGNLASAKVLDAGISRKSIIIFATTIMAVTSILILSDGLPVGVRIIGGFVFSVICGLIPGTLFSSVAPFAPSPALMSTVNGMMMQGSSLGQVILPILVSWIVGSTGIWASALFIILPAAAVMVIAAFQIGRLEAAGAR